MPPGIGYGIDPQIILQALQQRGLLPNDEGIGQPPFVQPQRGMTPPQVSPLSSPQISRKKGGISGFLKTPGLSDALLSTGSALLAQKDQAGSLGGALGRALPVGAQAFAQGKQEAALDEVFANAPPSMRKLMSGLSDPAREMMAMRMMQPPERDVREVGGNLVEVPQRGAAQVIYEAPAEPAEPPVEIRSYEAYSKMTPEERAGFLEYLKAKTSSTTVNVGAEPNPIERAVQQQTADFVTGGFEGARAAVDKTDTIDRVIAITERDAFERVSGPIEGRFGEMAATLAGDEEALEALAEFQAGGGLMTMAQLEAFTGPKTDFEYRQAQRLSFNDPTMTPEQIRAGLRFHRKVAEQEATRWADRMLELDPTSPSLGFSPADVRPQLDLAKQIKQRYGSAGVNDPAGIR